MPGDSGRIGVAYDPLGRPGPFVKKVVVYSNAPASPTTLTIKGSVSTLGGVERGTYAIKIGSAEFSSDHLNYPTTSILSRADLQLTVNNPTEKAIQVRIGELPKYVQIDNPSRKLEAFEPAEFSLSLNPNGIDHPGIYTDELAVIVTEADGSEAKGTIKLSAVLVDDFSGKDFQNAPRLELRTYFDFGQISPDRKAFEQQIELKNVGAETLIIHTTESQEAAIQVVGFTPGLSIAPQESKNLTLRINPSVMQKEGKTSISSNVAILCNAPSGPLRYIKVKLALQTI